MSLPPALACLTEQERAFVKYYCAGNSPEAAKILARYQDTASAHGLLRRADVGAAIRAEVMRLMATEGATIGFNGLKRIAQDTKAPAAAQVAAQKALLQGAGLLDRQEQTKEGRDIKDMSRDELRDYIASKQKEIEEITSRLAEGALDITPTPDKQPADIFE